MRLPDNRADRIKILVLALVGTTAVIYGVVFGGIRPLFTRKARLTQDIEKFRSDLDKANGLISRVGRTQDDNQAIVKEILAASSSCILHSRHGNHLIGARRIVEQAAAQAGVGVVSVTELGVSVLELHEAAPDQKGGKAFKSYTAEVSARSCLTNLVSMLESLETSNPLLCISKLQITADEKDPQRHQVFLRIQWPIWTDAEAAENLRSQLSEPEDSEQQPVKEERAGT